MFATNISDFVLFHDRLWKINLTSPGNLCAMISSVNSQRILIEIISDAKHNDFAYIRANVPATCSQSGMRVVLEYAKPKNANQGS